MRPGEVVIICPARGVLGLTLRLNGLLIFLPSVSGYRDMYQGIFIRFCNAMRHDIKKGSGIDVKCVG